MPHISPVTRNSNRTPVAYQGKSSGALYICEAGGTDVFHQFSALPKGVAKTGDIKTAIYLEASSNYVPIYEGDTVTLTF